MKKTIVLFSFLFNALNYQGQNIYDTYNPDLNNPININSTVHPGYTGEYQMFWDAFSWKNFPLATNTPILAISYKIEAVSFPFQPDCQSSICQSASGTTRIMHIAPNSYPNGFYSFNQFLDLNCDNMQGMSACATLNSHFFDATQVSQRLILPHTILKHTFYVHNGPTINDPVIDEVSFVIDHTRGMMSKYPFKNNNSPSTEHEHDVAINPFFVYPDPFEYITNPAQSSNAFNTINYFPIFEKSFSTSIYLVPQSPHLPPVTNNPEYFIHPPPFSLFGFGLFNAEEYAYAGYDHTTNSPLPGIEHQYKIDNPVDLTKYNKVERVIYNPSYVTIDINDMSTPQIFPSGYTFKTAPGVYATATQIQALDPHGLFGDPRKVPVYGNALNLSDNPNTTFNDTKSIYHIKAGSKLVIEPCVTIYDAIFEVEAGAELRYDGTKTTFGGNWQIVALPGSTVDSSPFTTPATPFACASNCYTIGNYNIGDLSITSNTTWTATNLVSQIPVSGPHSPITNNIVHISGTLFIQSGSTLTISTGVRLEFGPNAQVIVDRGAKLVANGVTFTSACQAIWHGIDVWGHPNLSQHPLATTAQGYLELNNCVVENADEGVSVRSAGSTGYEGGIVKANGTSFINNGRDVQFTAYRNFTPTPSQVTVNNLSAFVNCIFETNSILFDPTQIGNYDPNYYDPSPSAGIGHVSLWDVHGVRFEGCTFRNTASSLFKPHLRSVGIYSEDASFSLNGSNPNTFENLSNGIWSKASGATVANINITEQTFTNCIHGVVLEGTSGSSINSNTFIVPPSPQYGYSNTELEKGYDKPVGLYLIGAYDFTVTENNFNVTSTTPITGNNSDCAECSYDIVINNCARPDLDPLGTGNGIGTGVVYKNNIYHSSMGLQTEADNKGTIGAGLDVKCNTFSDLGFYDFAVTGRNGQIGGPPAIISTLKDQGSCQQPTSQSGNTYLGLCSNSEQVEIGTNGISFIYRDQLILLPSCHNVTVAPCIAISPNNCTTLINNCNIPCQLSQVSSASTAYHETLENHSQLIDGGNTTQALADINSNMSADQIKSILLGYSPYLSDVVLTAAINRNTPLPAGHLRDVLMANSPLTADVWQAVQNRNPALPSEILAQVEAVQTGISARYEKETELANTHFNWRRAETQLINEGLRTESLDTVITYLDSIHTPEALLRVLPLYMYRGNVDLVESTITELQTNLPSSYTHPQLAVASLYLELRANGKNWEDATAAQRIQLHELLTASPEQAVESRWILSRSEKTKYGFEPLPLNDTSSNHRPVQFAVPANETANTNSLRLFPNPNNGESLEVITAFEGANATLAIYDLTGRCVHTTNISKDRKTSSLALRGFSDGVYFVRVIYPNGEPETQKLILQK